MTTNPTLGPVPQFPERVTNTYEEILAQPAAVRAPLRAPHRRGQRHFEEGLGRSGANLAAFHGGAAAYSAPNGDTTERPTQFIEVQRAGQEFGRVEPGATNPPAAWEALDQVMLDNMAQGAQPTESMASTTGFMSHYPRPGHGVRVGPTWGFSVGAEVPGNIYAVKVAPPQGGRARRNEADVSDR